MKKIVLSSLLAISLGTVSATAGSIKFYTDANGQVFVKPGKGRTLLNVNPQEVMNAMEQASSQATTKTSTADTNAELAKEVSQMKEEIVALKAQDKKFGTSVFAKASKLKFSGTHYLGYTYKDYDSFMENGTAHKDSDSTGNFEMRRNYFQVKAYVLDDPKSYLRVTLDATYDQGKADDIHDEVDDHADVYVKYAYIYLDEVLPYTGVEFGMVHRPWIDYEEHQGWGSRSISKVFTEASESAHLTNSSDAGINFKTKTPYFTSEIGLFNGEGYHGENGEEEVIGGGNSIEWRATLAALGNGDTHRKATKDTYLDLSFFGQYNMDNSKNEVKNANGDYDSYDYTILGLHTVYNTPSFLIAAQYVSSNNDGSNEGDKGTSQFNGDGFSINSTYRFGAKKQYSVLARYDEWKSENEKLDLEQTTKNIIYGFAWQQNKNLKWLLTGQSYRVDDDRNYKGKYVPEWDSAMVTAEVHW
jgi:hypothetical protein